MLVRSPYEKGYYSAEDASLGLGQNLEEANSTAAKGAEMYVGCEGYYAARSRRVCGEKVEGADMKSSPTL